MREFALMHGKRLVMLVLAMNCLGAHGHQQAQGVLLTEFIADPAPMPQCHASTIVQTSSGLVHITYTWPRVAHHDNRSSSRARNSSHADRDQKKVSKAFML